VVAFRLGSLSMPGGFNASNFDCWYFENQSVYLFASYPFIKMSLCLMLIPAGIACDVLALDPYTPLLSSGPPSPPPASTPSLSLALPRRPRADVGI